MALPTWLRLIFTYAPLVLAMNPKTAAIAGYVADGIAAAEMIPGADGATKKASVLKIAGDAITSINNQKGGSTTAAMLPLDETLAAVSSGIDTVVSVANLLRDPSVVGTPAPVGA